MGEKVRVTFYFPKDLAEEFRRFVVAKYKGYKRGDFSWEAAQAIRNWIALHTDAQIDAMAKKPNPPASVDRVFHQVKVWMEREYGCGLEKGGHISRRLLERAIAAVRGSDPRTIKKWIKLFHEFGLIKPLTAGVWEFL